MDIDQFYTIFDKSRNNLDPVKIRRLQAIGCGGGVSADEAESSSQTMNGLAWLSSCSALPGCCLLYLEVA